MPDDIVNEHTDDVRGDPSSRRDFLKMTGVGIAGLALSPQAALGAERVPSIATPVKRGAKVERIKVFGRPDYLKVQGTAYEAGRAYGEAMAPSIHYTWRYVQERVLDRQQQKPDLLERLKWLVDETEKRWPLEIEEIAGVADGSGLDFEQVFLINRHLASLYCSNIGVTHSSVGPVAGGNLDDPRTYFIKDTHIKGQYRYVSVAWPGVLGCHNGMNEHGLCMMGSAAGATFTKLNPLPEFYTDSWSVFCRVLRSCRNVKEGVEFMSNPEINAGGNYLLLDPSGDIVIVEKNGSTVISVRKPDEKGFISSINYFVSEFNTEERMKKVHPMNTDRIPAMARARAKLNDKNGLSVVKSFLCDTELAGGDPPYPVSCWNTTISFIAIPTRKMFYASDGPPHIAGYHTFSLT
ncbi:MAG: twin-arginine translocation signal domain-containing protein [Armatimonadetes bacterium]|nr:twin-arginine translocation signal domain-containing protein [Armatimonadota bacterium]